jgi:plasmid stabilization system protein ParE
VRIFWTDAALKQLETIRDYLAQTSPAYAQRIVERLVKRSEQLAAFPHSGRMVPEYEIDEVRQVVEGAYRIIYLIKETQIEVL